MIKKNISLVVLIGLIVLLGPLLLSSARAANLLPRNITKPELVGPPWYDAEWNYRRPVTISNAGPSIAYYQVLITLSGSDFNFNQAKPDGSDVRFTHSDGTTELNYWIESWDKASQWAYVWVRIPGLASGDTTIYLYYNNPEALAASNGPATFDGFDNDWSQFAGVLLEPGNETQTTSIPGTIESPFVWDLINGNPTVSSGILNLADGSGIKSNFTFQYKAMGMRANFVSGNGNRWGGYINGSSGQRTMIGDLATDPDDIYLINFRTSPNSVLIPRVGGADWHNSFHVFEVRWKAGESMAIVDHGASTVASTQPLQVPNTTLPVTLYSDTGSSAALKIDWVYARQYRDPEPTVSIGGPQGLVELDVSTADSPDPIRIEEELTYQVTISNTSTIAALGVVVTNTLPMSVQFSSADPSQGDCDGTEEIVCSLGSIGANASANISINVITTVGGVITNTAMVNSLGYELDTGNNLAEEITLVDSIAPTVNWEQPDPNNGDYITFGGFLELEASATDNDRVAWVQFYLWDHLHHTYIYYDKDYSYPYQTQFNSDVLEPNEKYQLLVHAADRAGNVSNPGIIIIQRKVVSFIYLGFVSR